MSPGVCDFPCSYVAASQTLSCTMTCTGLVGNVTAVHFHDVTSSYSVTYNNGNPVAELPWTQDATGAWSVSGTGLIAAVLGAMCNDQWYLNVHTTDEPNGEVRANMVGMTPTCYISGYVADGTATLYGVAPTDGTIQNFCISYIGVSTVTGATGNCECTCCWNGVDQITLSGVCYGLTSDIDEITANYPDDTYEFISFSYYDFPVDCPFSFRYVSTDLEWTLAKLTSGKTDIVVATVNNIDGEVTVTFTGDGADFPVSTKPCRPYTGDVPTDTLECYFGYDDFQTNYDCSYPGYLCAIEDFAGDEYKTCTSYNYCYDCDCGASITDDLPLSGSACCDFSNCNIVSLDVLNCLGDSASLMSSAILFALFGTLIMIWLN
jgi:hypothetical protein